LEEDYNKLKAIEDLLQKVNAQIEVTLAGGSQLSSKRHSLEPSMRNQITKNCIIVPPPRPMIISPLAIKSCFKQTYSTFSKSPSKKDIN